MVQFTSFDDLDSFVKTLVKINTPKDQPINFYGTSNTFLETTLFLRTIARNVKYLDTLPSYIDSIHYYGYTFHFIYIDDVNL